MSRGRTIRISTETSGARAQKLARRATRALILVALASFASSAWADVNVATSGAYTAAYLELIPRLERIANDKIVTATTSVGAGADSIPSRLARGESIDVVIVADSLLEQLIDDGLVVADSRRDVARSAIGIVVKAGAAKPDIGSVDALRQALLRAKSIAYSGSVSGNYVSTELFQRLGIAEQVAAKSRKIDRERVAAVVARGEAEIGFQQISELLPVPGVDFVGPLPPEVQRVTTFSAAVVTKSRNAEAARAIVDYLASHDAMSVAAKTGLEPPPTRE
jgi:molybdate transport system substrate-binding protein